MAERWKWQTPKAWESRRREGGEWRGGIPLSNWLGGLGKRRELRSGVWGRAPAENEFGAFCGRWKDADSNYLLNFCFIKHCSCFSSHYLFWMLQKGGMGMGVPLRNRLGGLGSVVSSPSGVRGGARPKTNLVHFVAARRTLIAIICLISVSLNTAVA